VSKATALRLNDIAWNGNESTDRFFFLLVFKTYRAMQCVVSNEALFGICFGSAGSSVWTASLSVLIEAAEVISIAA
jgi:hypothetical protein